MMKKQVMHYDCDNCGDSSQEEDVVPHDGINRLPEEWAHIKGRSNSSDLFDLDLCTKCVEVMRKALLRRQKK